jgi:hypothetical protein
MLKDLSKPEVVEILRNPTQLLIVKISGVFIALFTFFGFVEVIFTRIVITILTKISPIIGLNLIWGKFLFIHC